MSRPAAVALAALAVGVAAAALIAGRSAAAPQLRSFATGAISQSNSRDGEAIFTVSNLAPGHGTSGTVTIGNTGSMPGSLVLSASDLSDSPGANGGILSSAVDMRVTDVTSGSDARVYTGKLDAMPDQHLLTLMPGDERTYRFAANLPDHGQPGSDWTGDNAFQRASASIGYGWTLTQTVAGPEPCGNVLRGDRAPNRLLGTLAGDRIIGYAGADLVRGRKGVDCVRGGRGPDRLHGNRGADRLSGGPAGDRIGGNRGPDRLRAGRGRDRLWGGNGDDVIWARGGGRDLVGCGPGRDRAVIDHRDRVRACEIVRIRG